MSVVPVAATLSCSRCGGRFENLRQAVAYCPYCGQPQAIPAAIPEGLDRYEADVAREVARADDAYQHAAAWQYVNEVNAPGRRRFLKGAVLLSSLAVGALIIFSIASQAIGANTGPAIGVAGTAVGILSALVMSVYSIASQSVRRRAPQRAELGQVAVACPNCGAPAELMVGQSASDCRYCRGVLLASDAIAARGVAEAALARRRALLEKYRQERLGMANISSLQGLGPSSTLITFGAFAAAMVVAAGAITYRVVIGERPYEPLLPVAWGIILLALTAGVLWLWRQRRRRQLAETAFRGLAERTHGVVTSELLVLIAWLDRYWPAAYEPAHLVEPSWALSATLGGFPISVHFKQRAPQSERRFLSVLLAFELAPNALRPPSIKSVPAAHGAYERCRALGFVPALNDAGVLATAEPELLQTLHDDPGALERVLSLAPELHAIARALGGTPAR